MKEKFVSVLLAAAMTVGGAAYSLSLSAGIAGTVSAAESVNLWFDHVTVKTSSKDTKSSGMYDYHMYMAKNEIEDCQFFLSPSEDMTVTVEVSDFTGPKGASLTTELYYEHYFMMLDGTRMPDAIPPVSGEMNLSAGTSQGFIVKTKTDADTAAGEYSAVVSVKKGSEVIKTTEITLTVWDFTLDEETPFDTAVDLSSYAIYSMHNLPEGDDGTLYKTYYDFMLENRVSAYTLPYDILDSAVDEYLDDPRVTSFMIGGDYNGKNTDDETIKAIYEKLSKNPEWAEKGYFYYVDEPGDKTKLDAIKAAGEKLEQLYPGYQMISPYFINIDMGDGTDQIDFMSKYINLWCTKVNAWTPADTEVEGAIHMMSEQQVKKYGDFASRMASEVAGGDKSWVYYCWEPIEPYTTFDASHQTLEQRVALWQAMDNDVTGLLYFTATEWTSGMWNTLHKTNASGYTVYGDGILLYPGARFNIDGPISSMRFESLRDGIEDYMYLCMAKELLDEAVYDELMESVTRNVVEWNDDSDEFYATRVALGNLIESASNTGYADGVVFKESSGYTANTVTGYVGGIDVNTTVMTVISSLENVNGIKVERNGTSLGMSETVRTGDEVVLYNEDDTVKTKFTIIIMGDVSGDGKVNLNDVSLILKHIAEWNVEINSAAADVDGSGTVNISDASLILKKIADWNVSFVKVPVAPGTVDIKMSNVIKTYTDAEQTPLNLKRGNVLGVKFTVGENEYARAITAEYPSWSDNYGGLTLSLYKWDTDYDTTIAAMPVYTESHDDIVDCQEIIFDICDSAGKGVGQGEYLWLVHKGYDTGHGVGIWTMDAPDAESGITVFYDGEPVDYGPKATINIGKTQ